MKYAQFLKELIARGCYEHRCSGKHLIYRHPRLNRNLVIPKHHKLVSPGLYRECNSLLQSIGA